jgi:hypothetical protein
MSPLPAFLWPATILGLVGLALLARFGWLYITETGPTGHIQSLIVGATFLISALQLVLLGVIGELLRMNRVLSERTLHRVRKLELAVGVRAEAVETKGATTSSALEQPRSEAASRAA